MNGSLTFLFFFFYLIFFSSLFIWESLERCWLFCRYIFLIAPIVGDGGRTSAIFEKKEKEMDALFIQKSSFLDCMARLDKHSNIYRFYTNGFCRLLGPVGIFLGAAVIGLVYVYLPTWEFTETPAVRFHFRALALHVWFLFDSVRLFFFFFKQLLCVQSI